MTPEGKVKKRVKEIVTIYRPHIYVHWPVMNGMGAPTLDCVGCADGDYFAVETKAEKKELTPRQKITKNDMERAGGKVFVIVGEDDTEMQELEKWLHTRVMRVLSRITHQSDKQ